MFRLPVKPKILLKTTLAAFLMITLSGAYCLFCCTDISAASQSAHHSTSRTTGHDHCKFSKNKSSETSQTAESVKAFECCGLKFSFYVAKLEKKRFPQNTPALASSFFIFPESVKSERKAGFTDFSHRAPVRGTRDLHVRNCVFRI